MGARVRAQRKGVRKNYKSIKKDIKGISKWILGNEIVASFGGEKIGVIKDLSYSISRSVIPVYDYYRPTSVTYTKGASCAAGTISNIHITNSNSPVDLKQDFHIPFDIIVPAREEKGKLYGGLVFGGVEIMTRSSGYSEFTAARVQPAKEVLNEIDIRKLSKLQKEFLNQG